MRDRCGNVLRCRSDRGISRGVLLMITDEQAINWLWNQYKDSMTMTEIDYWFDRFAVNREQQRASGVA